MEMSLLMEFIKLINQKQYNMNYWIKPSFDLDIREDNKIEELINYVCNSNSVTIEDLKSKKQHRNLSETRHVLFYILHKVFCIGCSNVGSMFNRDHATVLHGCKTVSGFIEVDPDFNSKMSTIINNFRYRPSKTEIDKIDKTIYYL